MKRSDIISTHCESIATFMGNLYRTVLESHGKIQYQLYIWEDGKLEALEGVQGDNTYLQPRDMEPRELFYVCKISYPYFNPWDIANESAPDDESERETKETEIIDWCVDNYKSNISDLLNDIIDEAKREE